MVAAAPKLTPAPRDKSKRPRKKREADHQFAVELLFGDAKKGYRFNPNAITNYHANVARMIRDEYQEKKLFPKDKDGYITRTDRITGHDTEPQVSLDGKITYLRFGYAQDLVPAMLEVLRILASHAMRVYASKRSRDFRGAPFRSRHYRDSFVLLRNNAMVIGPGPRFFQRASAYVKKFGNVMGDGELLAVSNIQPYARRIEEGAHWKKPWTAKAPKGVLKTTLRSVRSRRKTKVLYFSPKIEYGPLPGGIPEREYESQGSVTYGEGRNKGPRGKRRFVYSGRIMRKHRVYPIMFFGPPNKSQAKYGMNVTPNRWTHRKNVYQRFGDAATGPTIASQIRRYGGLVE